MASSVVTLQRYVRGWLTRKQLALEQQREVAMERQRIQEKLLKAKAKNKKSKDVKEKREDEKDKKKNGWFKAKLLRKISSQV